MERYFGPNGLLAQKVEGFEYRAAQQEMAQAVRDSLSSGVSLLAEAGTGTGKTWAYLIPSILSGKKVVVSTGTKTLQDQILDRDVPLLRRLIAPQLHAVCLKGRRNYLCRRRVRDFAYQPTFRNREEGRLYQRFQKWANATRSGDRAEITWLPDSFQVWNDVCCSSEQCHGQQCDDHHRCFLMRARVEAARAHLVLVNHHLFFADLALRVRNGGEAILEYDAVVFDEAHLLEDTAGIYFGVQLSNIQVADLSRDIAKESRKGKTLGKNLTEIKGITDQLEVLARTLHQSLTQGRGAQGRFRLDPDKTGKAFAECCGRIIHACERLSAVLEPRAESSPSLECLHRRSFELSQSCRNILERSDPSLVYWYDLTPHAVFLQGTPIEIAPILGEKLFANTSPVIMTSATLSIAGSFDYARHSLGTPDTTKEVNLPSPFDYEKQAMIYIPRDFPPPNDPAFCEHMADRTVEILDSTRGRALFLFTSYRNMNEVHRQILDRVPYPLLVQGQRPKGALLGEFKEKVDSVLLATSSFWQGIDVPGEALTCLLIDKLPFEVPDDPLVAARMARLENQGKNSFYGFQIPRAVIQLKQGMGRLIRTASDRGVVVLFDNRLLSKSYGRIFMRSMPPCRTVDNLSEIKNFILIDETAAYGASENAD